MAAPLPPWPRPLTTDGRYFVVRGRLWRMANRDLPEEARGGLVADLVKARREVGKALRAKDLEAEMLARQAVHSAKLGFGERGPPHGEVMARPTANRRMVRNRPYAGWFATLSIE